MSFLRGFLLFVMIFMTVVIAILAEGFIPVHFQLAKTGNNPISLMLPDGYAWDSEIGMFVIGGKEYPVGYSHKDTYLFLPELPTTNGMVVSGLKVSGPVFPVTVQADTNGDGESDWEVIVRTEVQ